ncbi:hypothetical protein ACFLYB_00270 [Chloroflexota bacterium]
MENDWGYTGLKALGKGRKAPFLNLLADQLYEWTKDITETYDEFPVGYTEWTLTGHLNIVASRCNYMPYSDYIVKLDKRRKSAPARSARPDLHIHNKDWEDSWMFELKRDSISLTSSRNMRELIYKKMERAYNQLSIIAKKGSKSEWAQHTCSALACTVWIDTHKGKNRWENKWSNRQKYEEDWEELWDKKWEDSLVQIESKLTTFGRIYYCGYRLPHSLVERHYNAAVKEARGSNFRPGPLAVAVLWVFTYKPWAKIIMS